MRQPAAGDEGDSWGFHSTADDYEEHESQISLSGSEDSLYSCGVSVTHSSAARNLLLVLVLVLLLLLLLLLKDKIC